MSNLEKRVNSTTIEVLENNVRIFDFILNNELTKEELSSVLNSTIDINKNQIKNILLISVKKSYE